MPQNSKSIEYYPPTRFLFVKVKLIIARYMSLLADHLILIYCTMTHK